MTTPSSIPDLDDQTTIDIPAEPDTTPEDTAPAPVRTLTAPLEVVLPPVAGDLDPTEGSTAELLTHALLRDVLKALRELVGHAETAALAVGREIVR